MTIWEEDWQNLNQNQGKWDKMTEWKMSGAAAPAPVSILILECAALVHIWVAFFSLSDKVLGQLSV